MDMHSLRTLLLALSLAAPFAVACGGADAGASEDAAEEGDEQDVVSGRAVKVTEADSGKTIAVKSGQSVILTLPSNATTGFKWVVTSTDRTFGYPTEKYVGPSSSAVGAGGSQKFTWKTSGPLPMFGTHRVTLEYRRPWETNGPAAKTFELVVDVIDPSAPPPEPSGAVQAGEADDGKTLDAASGQDIVLTLPSNPTTGYSWKVVSTNRTFGYPTEDFVGSEGGPIGSGGAQKFTWKTSGPLPMAGTHRVELHYKRGETGEPAKTFELVVRVR